MKTKRTYSRLIAIFFLFVFGYISLASSVCFAQTILGVACLNSKTKAVTIEKKCSSGKTTITGTNLLSAIGGVTYSKCYIQTGQASGAEPDGKVAVAVSCKDGDVVLSDSFDTQDSTRAIPRVSSKTFIREGKLSVANGIRYETTGEQNRYYTLSVQLVCCPG